MKLLYTAGILCIAGVFVSDIWLDINYELAANIALAFVAVVASAFAIRYAWWSKWWTNRIGKVYLAAAMLLALVLLQGAVAVWWTDDFPGRQVIRFGIYGLGGVAEVAMFVALVSEQLRDRWLSQRSADDGTERA